MPVLYKEDLQPIENYLEYFKHCAGETDYRMEASPRYLVGGNTIAGAMHELLGNVKIVFILREPRSRLFSYYKQRLGRDVPSEVSFDEYVRQAIEGFQVLKSENRHHNINVYTEDVYVRGLAEGFYSDYLSQWYEVFGDNIRVIFFDSLQDSVSQTMLDLCSWLELDPGIYESMNYSVENRTVQHRNKELLRIARYLNKRLEVPLRRFHFVKRALRSIYFLINEKDQREETAKSNTNAELEERLDEIYAPYNRALNALLRDRGYSCFPPWLQEKALPTS